MQLTPDELSAQGSAMVNGLNQLLSEANTRVVNLIGDKAILETKLSAALALIPKAETPDQPASE